MTTEQLPYLILLISIVVGGLFSHRVGLLVFAVALTAGIALGRLTPIALVWIAILGFSIWWPKHRTLPRIYKILSFSIFSILAVALSNHMLPGFNNLPVFQGVQVSNDSIPFTMYLNFDKTVVGLFIYLFFLKPRAASLLASSWATSALVLLTLLAFMIPTALAVGYVRWDVKFPELGWIWILNNLFFVCLAEEGFFRGFIQNGLSQVLPKSRLYAYLSVSIAALLFGLAHFKGGVAYVAFASVAGLFYGYTFHRTRRLECSILVHFGLNLVHFVFFSYPALQP